MKHETMLYTAALLALTLVLSACSTGSPQTGPDASNLLATQQAFIEQAAQATATWMAAGTQIAQLQTEVAQPHKTVVSGETAPTATPVPPTATVTSTTTATQVPPTATAIPPTVTPLPPTATPVPPTPTATPVPCTLARFVSDVTVPDGTTFAPNSTFTKTWRLKNAGSCNWTTAYSIVFVGGSGMNAPAAVSLPGTVAPGQVVDVSVKMTAPSSVGSYRGNWKLRDASGILFGTGNTDNPFYVDIHVTAPVSTSPVDFIASMCYAQWSSGAGVLDCQGSENDSRGFVMRVDNPTLESGYKDDEPVLLMNPQMITNGTIRGAYPAYHVQSGDHFSSIIGCAYQSEGCDVRFQLNYQIGNGAEQTLNTWREAYEGGITTVNVDLSGLAGNDVKFILVVTANGSSSHNRAQWLLPRIVH